MDWTQLLVVVLTLAGGLATWLLNERSKRAFEDYVRREQRYVELVKSLRGFHVGSEDAGVKEGFLTELQLCWLYGSDEVVRAAYAFLETVKSGQPHTDEQKEAALQNLVFVIRQDLLRRKPLKRSELKPHEFQILKVNPGGQHRGPANEALQATTQKPGGA